MDAFKKWIEEVTESASSRAIARSLGINHVTVTRRINSRDVQLCIDIADAYNTNPIPGLLAAKAIHQHHIDEITATHSLTDYTDLELAQEIVNRLQAAEDHANLAEPVFYDLSPLNTPVDELAARRTPQHNSPSTNVDDMPEDAVAYGHDLIGGTADDFEP